MSNPKDRKPVDVLNDLYSFAFGDEDTESISAEEAIKAVEAAGFDLDKLVKFTKEQAGKAQKQLRLQKASEQRKRLMQQTAEFATEKIQNIREEVMAMIKKLQGIDPQQAAVYFNRFEECGEEDLNTLKEDLQMLESMEEDED